MIDQGSVQAALASRFGVELDVERHANMDMIVEERGKSAMPRQ